MPDGTGADVALGRTTDLAVVAHPDDLELLVPGIIGACRDDPARAFTGIVCTSGAVVPGVAPGHRRREIGRPLPAVDAATRAAEQETAADLGRYNAVALLGHASADVVAGPGRTRVVEEVADLVARCRPEVVVTHDLADRHGTHVAVASITVDALRSLPRSDRPGRLLAGEGWRSLDWLPADRRVAMDVTDHAELAVALLGSHASQLAAKPYDVAAASRRRANATFAEPTALDDATEVVLAMDLTPLLLDDDLDPVDHLATVLDGFRDEVLERLAATRATVSPGRTAASPH